MGCWGPPLRSDGLGSLRRRKKEEADQPVSLTSRVLAYSLQGSTSIVPLAAACGEESAEGSVDRNFEFVVAQGRRKYMEDAAIVIPDLVGTWRARESKTVQESERSDGEPFSMFAVFDGHGGIEAARWAVENLWKFLAVLLHEGREPEEALRTSFSMVDSSFAEYCRSRESQAGCTAAMVLARRDEVWAANAGDTQIVAAGRQQGGQGGAAL